MSENQHTLSRFWNAHRGQSYERLFAIALLGFAVIRIVALFLSDMNLGPDETQYWFWSRSLEFGYFSKPPMIAWAIAFTTSVFGNHEWAARLASPLLHSGTAAFLFLTGRLLFSAREGFWAGIIWLTLPGVFLSSMLISTDALLLFFWAAALYFYSRLIETPFNASDAQGPIWRRALLLGVALGFGFLSKYAMIYFPLCAALCYAATRRRPPLKALFIASVIALSLIAPNLIWNAQNGFQTVSHTAANAKWHSGLFNPEGLIAFLAGQLAVFGPIGFAFLIYGLARPNHILGDKQDAGAPPPMSGIANRLQLHWRDIMLACFTLTPIILISTQSFISRAHANWAASAYPAAAILIAAWAFRIGRPYLIKASVALHLVLGVPFMIAITHFAIIDTVGLSKLVAPLRGWQAHGNKVATISSRYDVVMADDRDILGGLVYYARSADISIAAWNSNGHIDHHYEAAHPFNADKHKKILYVTQHADASAVAQSFRTITPLTITPTPATAPRNHAQPGHTPSDATNGETLYYFELEGFLF